MPWKVAAEHDDHFEVHGNGGARFPIRIRKKNLSPANLASYRAMAQGGKVQALAKGGPVRLAEGGDPALMDPNAVQSAPPWTAYTPPPASPSPSSSSLSASQANKLVMLNKFGQEAADKGYPGVEIPKEYLPVPDSSGPASSDPNLADPNTTQGLPPVPQPETAAASDAPATRGTPELLRRPDEAQPQAPTGSQYSASSAFKLPPFPSADWGKAQKQVDAFQQTGAHAADLQAQAETQRAKDLQGVYMQHENGLKEIEGRRVAETQAVQTQMDTLVRDIQSSKIDPERFWSSKSTAQKVATGLGLVLSGIGAGLTGQPNLAAQFLQRNIDRDIEAQRAELGKKENLLGFMLKKYGNIQEASVATRSYLTATLAAQVGLVGARAGSAQAQAQAEAVKSHLMQEAIAPQFQLINARHQEAMQRWSMSFQQQMMQRFSGASDPGYIPSGTPAPIPSEISLKGLSEHARAQGEMRVNMPEIGPGAHTYAPPHVAAEANKALSEYRDMERNLAVIEQLGKHHAGAINAPWPDADKRAFEVAANALQLSMNGLMGQNRFTGEENKHYSEMTTKPFDFLLGGAAQGNLNALRRLIQSKRMREYDQLGINTGQRPPEQPLIPGAR